MNRLITACLTARTIKEVDSIVEANIEALIKHPQLKVFPRNAYQRIHNLEKEKNKNTELIYKN